MFPIGYSFLDVGENMYYASTLLSFWRAAAKLEWGTFFVRNWAQNIFYLNILSIFYVVDEIWAKNCIFDHVQLPKVGSTHWRGQGF